METIRFTIELVCENAIQVSFHYSDDTLPPTELAQAIAHCRIQVINQLQETVWDVVASYTSLLVYYHFTQINSETFKKHLAAIIASALKQNASTLTSNTIEIPVCYNLETGPDLKRLAKEKGISHEDIIQLHSFTTYTVYAIGFAPGFAYLGFVDEQLQSPRLDSPRRHVPKGSIGIADKQTGIYPCNSPGGWNIIGRTPVDMLDMEKGLQQACPVNVGDRIKFIPISTQEFLALGGKLYD